MCLRVCGCVVMGFLRELSFKLETSVKVCGDSFVLTLGKRNPCCLVIVPCRVQPTVFFPPLFFCASGDLNCIHCMLFPVTCDRRVKLGEDDRKEGLK